MKTLICFLCGIVICFQLSAQAQELQQLKLDLEKLAQFKLMLAQAKSGYQSLTNGYTGVINAGKSNFNLHQQYLDGLNQVNTEVKSSPVVQRIYRTRLQILSDCKSLLATIKQSSFFTSTEMIELSRSISEIEETIAGEVELLNAVLTDGKLRMSDADRSQLIASIDKTMVKQAEKLKAIQDSYNQVLALRVQNKRDINALKRLGNLQ